MTNSNTVIMYCQRKLVKIKLTTIHTVTCAHVSTGSCIYMHMHMYTHVFQKNNGSGDNSLVPKTCQANFTCSYTCTMYMYMHMHVHVHVQMYVLGTVVGTVKYRSRIVKIDGGRIHDTA